MKRLTVGLSPCPNDTFIFHGLFHDAVPRRGFEVEPYFADVEDLNRKAMEGTLEITKISIHAYAYLRDRYTLLNAGAALGRGCGPLLICRPGQEATDLAQCRVAIPGFLTSATLLLRLFAPELSRSQLVPMVFDQILQQVASGQVDAGLIIHESRFTYEEHGLVQRVDLGEWWESTQGLPIPLGGILARRDLGEELIANFDASLRASVLQARENPAASRQYVREHAQELSDDVTRAHIGLYVNDFTVDLGKEGQAAIEQFLRHADDKGVLDG